MKPTIVLAIVVAASAVGCQAGRQVSQHQPIFRPPAPVSNRSSVPLTNHSYEQAAIPDGESRLINLERQTDHQEVRIQALEGR